MKILLAYQIRSDVLQWKIVESCCTAPAYLIPLPNATFCRLALDFHKNAKAFDHTSRSKLKLFDSTERVVRECLMSDWSFSDEFEWDWPTQACRFFYATAFNTLTYSSAHSYWPIESSSYIQQLAHKNADIIISCISAISSTGSARPKGWSWSKAVVRISPWSQRSHIFMLMLGRYGIVREKKKKRNPIP